jgi:hypothetical protein
LASFSIVSLPVPRNQLPQEGRHDDARRFDSQLFR